ncbi:hypothetical protein WJX73_004003 [Symbiochloris irregularis]|uniref:Fatty acid desaturase domain-containing protein n=1 Tax=Symbiochloris irregularis TaxID=706552 RepID=A0AAW1PME2_9CHLO
MESTTGLDLARSARAITANPPFTVGTLRKAIPAHCFDRSLAWSLFYLLADISCIVSLGCGSQLIDHPSVPRVVAWTLLWPLYWFLQGAVATGVWVIAHECGHQAFSKWQSVNDGVGLVLHSALLVPYFSWKHSHRRHHSNTGNVQKDEVFVPKHKGKPQEDGPSEWQDIPLVKLSNLVNMLLFGWPLYLLANVSGREYEGHASHFDPYSPIFSKRERSEIVASDAVLGLVLYGLYTLGSSIGWAWFCKVYLAPYLMVNGWLVMITLLQHTHPALPHYHEATWDWLRGALATCDRSYGFLDHFHHHIADTHVLHHLFSTIPHYHAQEATAAIKPILGDYYNYDSRNVFVAMWQDYPQCVYVAPDSEGEEALWYRK